MRYKEGAKERNRLQQQYTMSRRANRFKKKTKKPKGQRKKKVERREGKQKKRVGEKSNANKKQKRGGELKTKREGKLENDERGKNRKNTIQQEHQEPTVRKTIGNKKMNQKQTKEKMKTKQTKNITD